MHHPQSRRCKHLLPLAALTAAALSPQPAQAQAWIGAYVGQLIAQEAQYRCMTGVPLPPNEIAEAQVPAEAVMAAYWHAAHGSDRADVAALFHQSKKARWETAELAVVIAPGQTVVDTLARAAAAIDPVPIAFVRAGQAIAARGVWQLRSASGEPAGFYLADFNRKAGVWKLRTLRAVPASEDMPAVTQFCIQPGDVEIHRARIAAAEQARAEKRARKARLRAEQGRKPGG